MSNASIVDSANMGQASYSLSTSTPQPFDTLRYRLVFGLSDLLNGGEGFDIKVFDSSINIIGMDSFTLSSGSTQGVFNQIPITPTSDLNGYFLVTALSGSSFDAIFVQAAFGFTSTYGEEGEYAITTTSVSAVPVPAALPMFLAALSGLGFFGWRRRRRATATA